MIQNEPRPVGLQRINDNLWLAPKPSSLNYSDVIQTDVVSSESGIHTLTMIGF